MFFELQLNICNRFPNLSPFDIRKQRFSEVFLLLRRLNDKSSKEAKTPYLKKVNGKTRCYVQVKDNE